MRIVIGIDDLDGGCCQKVLHRRRWGPFTVYQRCGDPAFEGCQDGYCLPHCVSECGPEPDGSGGGGEQPEPPEVEEARKPKVRERAQA